jgi:hypothetical protein
MFEQSDCEVVSLSGFWRISYVFPRMVIFKQSQVVSNQKIRFALANPASSRVGDVVHLGLTRTCVRVL